VSTIEVIEMIMLCIDSDSIIGSCSALLITINHQNTYTYIYQPHLLIINLSSSSSSSSSLSSSAAAASSTSS